MQSVFYQDTVSKVFEQVVELLQLNVEHAGELKWSMFGQIERQKGE